MENGPEKRKLCNAANANENANAMADAAHADIHASEHALSSLATSTAKPTSTSNTPRSNLVSSTEYVSIPMEKPRICKSNKNQSIGINIPNVNKGSKQTIKEKNYTLKNNDIARKGEFKVLYTNIQGLISQQSNHKLKYLKGYVENDDMDLICLTETHLHKCTDCDHFIDNEEINIKSYNVIRADRQCRKGGGCCIYISKMSILRKQ
jgi:hypothetical protein